MLSLRRTRIVDIVPDDYTVIADGREVGRIYKPVRGRADAPPWEWSLFCIPQTRADRGDAMTLEETKQAFRAMGSREVRAIAKAEAQSRRCSPCSPGCLGWPRARSSKSSQACAIPNRRLLSVLLDARCANLTSSPACSRYTSCRDMAGSPTQLA